MCRNRVRIMYISALYDGDSLSDEELKELEDYISKKRKERKKDV